MREGLAGTRSSGAGEEARAGAVAMAGTESGGRSCRRSPGAVRTGPHRCGWTLALVLASASVGAACDRERCGPVPGSGEASGGSARYRITLVDGEGGAPFVGLSYSSRSGTGVAGMGWTLVAGSTVFRCPPSVTQDGYSDPVRFHRADRLCIDGTRLVPVRGEHGRDGTVYLEESDGSAAVAQRGDLEDQEVRFVSVDGDKVQRIYDVPVIPAGVDDALEWSLREVRFPDGRRTRYHYRDFGPGERLLDRIEWQAGEDPRSIRFIYEARHRAKWSFLSGGESRATRLLTRIELDDGEPSPVVYQFRYQKSRSSERELLESVQACREAPKPHCGTPTRIGWLDADIAFREPAHAGLDLAPEEQLPLWTPGNPPVRVRRFLSSRDFDADGFSDVLMQLPDDTLSVLHLDVENRLRHPPAAMPAGLRFTESDAEQSVGGDLRHLGAGQLIGHRDGELAVSDWRAGAFTETTSLGIPHTGMTVAFDASGDGRADVLTGTVDADSYVVTHYRNRSPNGARIRLAAPDTVARLPLLPGLALDDRAVLGAGRHVIVRRDGRIHRVIEFVSTPAGDLEYRVDAPEALGIDVSVDEEVHLADVNGDGNDDLLIGRAGEPWVVQLNRDGRFGPRIRTSLVDERVGAGRTGALVVDVNADGSDELVFPSQRVMAFCVPDQAGAMVCSESLAPEMDFGLYRYSALYFWPRADGSLAVEQREIPGLLAQANRTDTGDIDGDGYTEFLSAFDPGVRDGQFRDASGKLHRCPKPWRCGLHVSGLVHAAPKDRKDVSLDTVKRVERRPGEFVRWSYYPLSNPVRALYRVPALDAPDRYLEPSRFYFTSSMFVVGEFQSGRKNPENLRFRYGGGSYHSQGRGFDGFQWITEENLEQRQKRTWWWRQVFPFRGTLERVWVESLNDREQDPARGSPGSRYLEFYQYSLRCRGPENHPLSRRFDCKPSEYPVFETESALEWRP